ncbi:MAG: Glycosyl transferase family 2 [candidate division WS6 bacterium GW2011_GWE1_36_69]|nr:MAG: Glycosyl transferase family 2 [candidate division WS6 bacterium GW2011_GWE1_36_69]
MKISIVIPAYNEENRIGKTLPHVISYLREFSKKNQIQTEIIVVNDGAKDKTLEVLNTFREDIIIALKQGITKADGDYIYIADADFSTPIEYIEHFVEKMDKYDCVIGSRALGKEEIRVSLFRKILGNSSNLLIRAVLGLKFKDTQCGFKMFNQKCKTYFLMCENNRLQKNGLLIKEMPVEWEAAGESHVTPGSYFKTFAELLHVRKAHK